MVHKSFESFLKKDFDIFKIELKNEWNNQDKKFPNQTHTIEQWLIIIMEEIGEICKEVLEFETEFDFVDVYKEIIQSITLLIRLRYSVYSIDLRNKKIII